MTNGKKIGGLIVLLAIPLVILLFLELFGQHHYDVPTDPAEAEGLSAEVPASFLGQPFQWPNNLVDAQGKNLARNAEAKSTILYFLPSDVDTARFVLEELARVQDIFENNAGVQLLTLVNTAPADSLAILAEQYRSQPNQWKFAAGTLSTGARQQMMPPAANSATLMLIDKHRVRGYYDGMQEKEIDRLVAETRILLRNVE